MNKVHRKSDKTPGAWKEFIEAMRSGEIFECDQEMWYYWLEVLPPPYMGYHATLPDGSVKRASFGQAEGAERVVAFWSEGGRYFGCQTEEINPYG